MRNIKLTIEYDGSAFCGWQIQPNLPTIQGSLQEAIHKMTGEILHLQSSGRTDAGVHALAMPANFKTTSRIPLHGFVHGLNCLLPDEIVVLEAVEMEESFHALRDCLKKQYRYLINTRPVRRAVEKNRYWELCRPLNMELMNEAAHFFVGQHDFTSFAAAEESSPSKVRTIYELHVSHHIDHAIAIDVVGNGFLMNMVRNIAGTLVEIGMRKRSAESIPTILEAKERQQAGVCAPPSGLYLVKVNYG